ncbi:hypothetical protein PV326_005253, partial [Microctonus aethiopoides]
MNRWFNENVGEHFFKKVEEFEEGNSRWTMFELINLMGGVSTWLDLPSDIELKKAVVNIKNDDEFCFLWALTSSISSSFPKGVRDPAEVLRLSLSKHKIRQSCARSKEHQ